ncbi:uncharacterized protein METZ01_LOCUS292821, partial [marine metagenome]
MANKQDIEEESLENVEPEDDSP